MAHRQAAAAIAASLERFDGLSKDYWHATGQRRPPTPFAGPELPAAVTREIEVAFPGFRKILATGNEQEMRKLIDALAPMRTTAAAQVLATILEYSDLSTHGEFVARLLGANQVHHGAVDIGRVIELLHSADPDRRLAAASFFARVFHERESRVKTPDRAAAVLGLIQALSDPVMDVRQHAAPALGSARARGATAALVDSLAPGDVPRSYIISAVAALRAIGDVRAVPGLERLARASHESDYEVRLHAARAALDLRKTVDRAAAARALLFDQPSSPLERDVLAGGKPALPLAWKALAGGSPAERRHALALLGWVRDVASVPVLVNALESTHGALSRQQLLFDLNVILLTEAAEVSEANQVDSLRSQHLAALREAIAGNLPARWSDTAVARCAQGIVILPETAERFSAALGQIKQGCGVAHQTVRSARGVARVASTIYAANASYRSWVTIHQKVGADWRPLSSLALASRSWIADDPNLQPAFHRDYGVQDPLTIVRLDLAMERVRRGYEPAEGLSEWFVDDIGEVRGIPRALVPALERYRRDRDIRVRFAAEFAVARATGVPDVRVMIRAIEEQPDGPIRGTAGQVLSGYIRGQFELHGRLASADDRLELTAATMSLKGRNVPERLPQDGDITRFRRWADFALVDVQFPGGPRAESGYSLLFERRGDRWVFVYVPSSWIS